MGESIFFNISTLLYFLAMVVYITYVAFRKNAIGITATTLTASGFICQTIAMLMRWVGSYNMWMISKPSSTFFEALLRGTPIRNLYESLVFFVWSIVLIYLIIEFRYKNRFLGAFVMPVAGLTLAFIDVSGLSKEIQPLIPALQSNWLLFHVILSFLGYASFGVSFAAAVVYLIMVTESRNEKAYIFWSITVGIFLILLIAMGIDYLSMSISPGESYIRNYFLKSTFKSSSGFTVITSWLLSILFIIFLWRYGLGLKKVISSFSVSHNILDEIGYKSIAIGFPLFTLGGVIMGAVWANSAWGTYWSWDPKETWSLITWFIYAGYIHARFIAGWRGKKVAVLSLIGFVAVVFTYLGVNLFLSGLHSYGGA